MENNQYVYLRFPVQILKGDFYNIGKVCKDALSYGIMEYMERKEYEGVKGCIRAYNELSMSYNNFNRSDYFDQPKQAIDHLEELNYSKCYNEKSEVYNQFKDSIDKPITCSIKRDLLFEFMNKPKTEFEIMVFRFFIALNSIQGTDKFGRGSWDRFFAVSFGYNTDKVLKHGLGKHEKIDVDLLTPEERVIYLKYSTKRMKENIKKSLELHWYLKWVSGGTDGIFFSWEMGYKALNTEIRKAVNKRKKPLEKLKRDKKKGKEESDNEVKNNLLD